MLLSGMVKIYRLNDLNIWRLQTLTLFHPKYLLSLDVFIYTHLRTNLLISERGQGRERAKH